MDENIEVPKSKKASVVEKFSQDNVSSGQILQEGACQVRNEHRPGCDSYEDQEEFR